MITKEQTKEYLLSDGNKCPYCGSWDIEAHDWDGETVSESVVCHKCEKEWKDIYKLVGIEEI